MADPIDIDLSFITRSQPATNTPALDIDLGFVGRNTIPDTEPAAPDFTTSSLAGAFVDATVQKGVEFFNPRAADDPRLTTVPLDTFEEKSAAALGQAAGSLVGLGASTFAGAKIGTAIGAFFGGIGAPVGLVIGGAVGAGTFGAVALWQGARRELFGVEDDTKRLYKQEFGTDAPQEVIVEARDKAFWGIIGGEALDVMFTLATAGSFKLVGTGVKIAGKALTKGSGTFSELMLKQLATKQAATRIGRLVAATKGASKKAVIGSGGEALAEVVQTTTGIAAARSAVLGTDFTEETITALKSDQAIEALQLGAIGGAGGGAGGHFVGSSVNNAIMDRAAIITNKFDALQAQDAISKGGVIEAIDTVGESESAMAGIESIAEAIEADAAGVNPSTEVENAIDINGKISEVENEDSGVSEVIIPKDQMDSAKIHNIYGDDPNLIIETLENGDTRVMDVPGAPPKYMKELQAKQTRIEQAKAGLKETERQLDMRRTKAKLLQNKMRVNSDTLQDLNKQERELGKEQDTEGTEGQETSIEEKRIAIEEKQNKVIADMNAINETLEESFNVGVFPLEKLQRDLKNAIVAEEEKLFGTSAFEDPSVRFERMTATDDIPINSQEDVSATAAVNRIRKQVDMQTLRVSNPVEKYLSIFNNQRRDPAKFSLTALDFVRQKFNDNFRPVFAAVQFAQNVRGKVDLRPGENIMLNTRLYAGAAARMNAVVENGMVNSDGKVVTPGGFRWLSNTDGNAATTRERNSELLTKTVILMIAERIRSIAGRRFEQDKADIADADARARKTDARAEGLVDTEQFDKAEIVADKAEAQFERVEQRVRATEGTEARPIAGIAQAQQSDLQRENLLTEEQFSIDALRGMENDPDIEIMRDMARRYRLWSNANLEYMRDTGLITEDTYNLVNDNNAHYVAMQRLFEASDGTELNTVMRDSVAIGSTSQLIHTFIGSNKTIKDPYQSLLESSARILREGSRNDIKNMFVDMIEPTGLTLQQARSLDTVGRQVDKKNSNTISLVRNGNPEFWEFDKDVARQLNRLDVQAPGPLLTLMSTPATVLRNTIIYSPGFAVRNIQRDTISRFVVSRTAVRIGQDTHRVVTDPNELKAIAKARGELTVSDLQVYGGGFAGYYMNDVVDFHRAQAAALRDKKFQDDTILVRSWDSLNSAAEKYKRLIEGGETFTRMLEFRSAYSKAQTDLGYNERESKLYAAYQSRDLIDFAVMGEWIRDINRLIPFTNASIRGLVKSVRTMRENPQGFMMRWGLFVAMPVIAERMYNMLVGAEDEYDQQEAWKKDLFWSFKTGDGPSDWLRFAKPFEIGVLGSGVGRLIDAVVNDDDRAFEDYTNSFFSNVVPVRIDAIAGPLRALVQAKFNFDSFRQRHIVPYFESQLKLELRDPKGASKAAMVISDFAQQTGLDVVVGAQMADPRTIDFLAGQVFGNIGRAAIDASDIESLTDLKDFGMKHIIGMNTKSSLGRDVNFVWEYARSNGVGAGNKNLRTLRQLTEVYYDASDPDEKEKFRKLATQEATAMRNRIEDFGMGAFGK